jgi:hypothetical protein
MNANGPPKRESRPGGAADLEKLLADHRQYFYVAQPHISSETLHRWFGQAQGMANEYHRSHRVQHLRAFCRQIIGIMATVERALPR